MMRQARAKLARKGLDLIVGNSPAAINRETSTAMILAKGGGAVFYTGTKAGLAARILDALGAAL
jgi:hypothetical protein